MVIVHFILAYNGLGHPLHDRVKHENSYASIKDGILTVYKRDTPRKDVDSPVAYYREWLSVEVQ